MKRIVPIITLCLAIAAIALNVTALICACVANGVPIAQLISTPTAIVGLVVAMALTPFAFLFKKDILCKISLYIDLVSLAIAIAAVCVAFAAL